MTDMILCLLLSLRSFFGRNILRDFRMLQPIILTGLNIGGAVCNSQVAKAEIRKITWLTLPLNQTYQIKVSTVYMQLNSVLSMTIYVVEFYKGQDYHDLSMGFACENQTVTSPMFLTILRRTKLSPMCGNTETFQTEPHNRGVARPSNLINLSNFILAMKTHRHELIFNLPARRGFGEHHGQGAGLRHRKAACAEGLVLVNSMHISSSIFINDHESGLIEDWERWLEKLAPEKPHSQYRHNDTGEDNADAHLKRTIMGREVVVAITEGKLDFGPWEQIFYGEFDGMRRKRVLVKIIGE